MRNLLSNAVKFNPVGEFIRLDSIEKGDLIEAIIRGLGIAISSEQLASQLNQFKARMGTISEVGTGLGLYIRQKLIERLGGTLKIKSQPQNGTLGRVQLRAIPN